MRSRYLFAGLIAAAALMLSGCDKVPAGNVGVKFYLLGGDKGVDMETLKPGRYWIGINEELYLFPTFTQTAVWTKEPIDGDRTDESIKFQDKDGLSAEADIGITYSLEAEMIPALFQKYRKGIDEITDVYLRRLVQDQFVRAAATRSIEDMYGTGKGKLLTDVLEAVRKDVSPLGIKVENLYATGSFRLPPSVLGSINAKIQATQIAQQKENELRAAQADAEKKRANAQGEADSRLMLAKAEAEAIRIKGDALRENPRLVELSAIEKWDGVLPHFNGGGSMPFITGPSSK
jgi:regulator of protease activity HflC (stomatin/prohibitin superfamily)